VARRRQPARRDTSRIRTWCSLDDLVGARDVADPRTRLRPRRLNGRTVLALTRPGGVQAWKILVPAGSEGAASQAGRGGQTPPGLLLYAPTARSGPKGASDG
jgi:hypothetical protein